MVKIICVLFLLTLGLQAKILDGVHPGYDLVDLRPEGFEPLGIGGMDWLPDGRLAVAEWGLNRQNQQTSQGKVLIISGVMGSGAHEVAVEEIATGLSEPMGLTVIDGEIYVAQRPEPDPYISRYTYSGSDWTHTRAYEGWGMNESYHWHIFNFGLEYKDGHLWWCAGSRLNARGGADRGGVLKVDLEAQSHEFFAGGLRTPNGLGVGPEYDFWTPDNEGNWLSHNKMIHLAEGRWYGHAPGDYPIGTWPDGIGVLDVDGRNEWPSTAIVAHDNSGSGEGSGNEPGRSPTEPMYLPSGTFAGQFLAGDIHRGGLQRYFLEKVNGNWQSAIFDFTQGLECGVNRLILGTDSKTIIMGGAGVSDSLNQLGYTNFFSWNWKKKVHGFQKLVPNGNSVFEMLAIRSTGDNTFEIEFTEPANSAAGTASNYHVNIHTWEPAPGYGAGRFQDRHDVTVNSATLSGDGRRVVLNITGLQVNYLVNFTLNDAIKSQGGENIWSPHAWYTLTQFGPGEEPGINSIDLVQGRSAISLGHPSISQATRRSGTGTVTGPVLELDGVDDEMHFQPLVLSGDFSISAWVNPVGAMDEADVIMGTRTGPELRFSNSKLQLSVPGGSPLTATTNATAGVWQHVGLTRSGGTATLYLNGVAVGSGPFAGSFTAEYLGGGSAGFFQGELDDVRIYDRELAAASMTTLAGLGHMVTGLIHRWEFGEEDAITGFSLNLKNKHPASMEITTGSRVKFEIASPVFLQGALEVYHVSGQKITELALDARSGRYVAWWQPAYQNPTGMYIAVYNDHNIRIQKKFITVN